MMVGWDLCSTRVKHRRNPSQETVPRFTVPRHVESSFLHSESRFCAVFVDRFVVTTGGNFIAQRGFCPPEQTPPNNGMWARSLLRCVRPVASAISPATQRVGNASTLPFARALLPFTPTDRAVPVADVSRQLPDSLAESLPLGLKKLFDQHPECFEVAVVNGVAHVRNVSCTKKASQGDSSPLERKTTDGVGDHNNVGEAKSQQHLPPYYGGRLAGDPHPPPPLSAAFVDRVLSIAADVTDAPTGVTVQHIRDRLPPALLREIVPYRSLTIALRTVPHLVSIQAGGVLTLLGDAGERLKRKKIEILQSVLKGVGRHMVPVSAVAAKTQDSLESLVKHFDANIKYFDFIASSSLGPLVRVLPPYHPFVTKEVDDYWEGESSPRVQEFDAYRLARFLSTDVMRSVSDVAAEAGDSLQHPVEFVAYSFTELFYVAPIEASSLHSSTTPPDMAQTREQRTGGETIKIPETSATAQLGLARDAGVFDPAKLAVRFTLLPKFLPSAMPLFSHADLRARHAALKEKFKQVKMEKGLRDAYAVKKKLRAVELALDVRTNPTGSPFMDPTVLAFFVFDMLPDDTSVVIVDLKMQLPPYAKKGIAVDLAFFAMFPNLFVTFELASGEYRVQRASLPLPPECAADKWTDVELLDVMVQSACNKRMLHSKCYPAELCFKRLLPRRMREFLSSPELGGLKGFCERNPTELKFVDIGVKSCCALMGPRFVENLRECPDPARHVNAGTSLAVPAPEQDDDVNDELSDASPTA